jgi:signal transduction histidine kinase
MTGRHPDRFLGWLRGVRGRLVATYVLSAALLAVAGVALFTFVLDRGLLANVDTGLRSRAATLVSDVRDSNIEQVGPSPTTRPAARQGVDAFTAVFAPGGRLVAAQPAQLPAQPLTAQQLRTPPTMTSVHTTDYGGQSFRVLIQPVTRSDGVWTVVAATSLNAAHDASAQVRHALYVAVPVLLILVGVGAWLLSGAALKPVDRMRTDAQNLSEHDTGERLTEPATRDSLNGLARTFNALLDRLHRTLDSQRSLVADAGHELRTPLAVLQTELETAVRPNRTRADLVDSINHARAEVTRLAMLSEDLLLLAQADGGQPIVRRELTDVGELIDGVVRAHHESMSSRSVTVTISRPAALIAEIDPVALRRILDNLLSNATRYTPVGGALDVRAAVTTVTGDAAPATELSVSISDTGPGFAPELLPHLFERFTRGDSGRGRDGATSGTGLGLAIVDALVGGHGGTVTAENRPDGGAVVNVRLPLPRDAD